EGARPQGPTDAACGSRQGDRIGHTNTSAICPLSGVKRTSDLCFLLLETRIKNRWDNFKITLWNSVGPRHEMGHVKHLKLHLHLMPRLIDKSFFASMQHWSVRSRVKQCRRLAAALTFGSNRMWSEEYPDPPDFAFLPW